MITMVTVSPLSLQFLFNSNALLAVGHFLKWVQFYFFGDGNCKKAIFPRKLVQKKYLLPEGLKYH